MEHHPKMRKLLFFLLAVTSLAAAGAVADGARSAATATATVKISSSGYTPATVSIALNEDVAFANTDTVSHTVDFKSMTGVKCTPNPPVVIPPGQAADCTFSSAGKFNFSDPVNKGKNFRGTVNVAQPLTSSLTATPTSVPYGRKTTLAGKIVSQLSGQSLQVLALQCGAASAKAVGSVTTTTGGAFSYQTPPLMATAYTVKAKNLTSSSVTVKVLPALRLSKVARHRYALRVTAAQSFAGKYATFQRYRAATKRWRAVRRVLLKANATGKAPTVITSAKFRSTVKARTRVRVVLGQKQVGSCYLAGRSNTIRS
jgi:plastocyanin